MCVPKRVDRRVESLPDGNQGLLVLGHQDALFLTKQVSKDRNNCIYVQFSKEESKKAFSDIRQAVPSARPLDLDTSVNDGLGNRCLNLADDLVDKGFKKVVEPFILDFFD